MPITKQPKKNEPLWKEWDYKAQKKGVHHTVYSVNGDRYTGEWDKNQKNGESLARAVAFVFARSVLLPQLNNISI